MRCEHLTVLAPVPLSIIQFPQSFQRFLVLVYAGLSLLRSKARARLRSGKTVVGIRGRALVHADVQRPVGLGLPELRGVDGQWATVRRKRQLSPVVVRLTPVPTLSHNIKPYVASHLYICAHKDPLLLADDARSPLSEHLSSSSRRTTCTS